MKVEINLIVLYCIVYNHMDMYVKCNCIVIDSQIVFSTIQCDFMVDVGCVSV